MEDEVRSIPRYNRNQYKESNIKARVIKLSRQYYGKPTRFKSLNIINRAN